MILELAFSIFAMALYEFGLISRPTPPTEAFFEFFSAERVSSFQPCPSVL